MKGELFKNESRLRYEALTDWADVTGAAFMGLTLGCARCHDHKYDPISQRDYYGLQAVFAESEQVEIPVVTKPTLGMFRHNYPKLIGVVEAKKRLPPLHGSSEAASDRGQEVGVLPGRGGGLRSS